MLAPADSQLYSLWNQPWKKEAALPNLTPSPKGSLHPIISYLRIGKPGSLALTGATQKGISTPEFPTGLSQRRQLHHTIQLSHLSFSVSPSLLQVLFPSMLPNLLCTQISRSLFLGNMIWGRSLGAMIRDEVVTLVSDPFYLFQKCFLVILS